MGELTRSQRPAPREPRGAPKAAENRRRIERNLDRLTERLEALPTKRGSKEPADAWLDGVARRIGSIAADLRRGWDDPTIAEQRLRDVVDVRQPLLLITQIQRSGGTLLSQLFDGHPELHAHPHELHVGYPKKFDWPPLEPGDALGVWFETLFERPIERFVAHGYRKEIRPGTEASSLPFVFSVALQREIFQRCAQRWDESGARGAFDAYMTSYFNAWLDNQNLYGTKRWVTGFVPMLGTEARNVERYFETYPDGLLISIARDPRTWFASAHAHYGTRAKERFGAVETAVEHWRHSVEAGLAAAQRYGPDRVLLTCFEALVLHTEPTMRAIAERLGIRFSPHLLEPTFNGMPIAPNSSFDMTGPGVHAAAAHAPDGRLAADVEDYLTREALPLYERYRAHEDVVGDAPPR